MNTINLARYNNDWFDTGGGIVKRGLWYFVNVIFFKSALLPFSGLKVFWLKVFGASVGKNVNIKPAVNIKYPWRLAIGDNTWIGENVWIDNLEQVTIGRNCCLSQGALLLCGNHDYSKSTFDLMVAPITLDSGTWIGARAIVTGGTHCRSHTVVAAGSVVGGQTEPYTIYRGNPAVSVKKRIVE